MPDEHLKETKSKPRPPPHPRPSTTGLVKNKLEQKKYTTMTIPYIHPLVLDELEENGKIIEEKQIKALEEKYKEQKAGIYLESNAYVFVKRKRVKSDDKKNDTTVELYYLDPNFRLGQGSFGAVYLAQNLKTGALLAVKEQRTSHTSEKEIEALKSLNQREFSITLPPDQRISRIKILADYGNPTLNRKDTIYVERTDLEKDEEDNDRYYIHYFSRGEWQKKLSTLSQMQKALPGGFRDDKEDMDIIFEKTRFEDQWQKLINNFLTKTALPETSLDFIGMPLIPGKNLNDFLKDPSSSLSFPRRLELTCSMITELKEMNKQYIHRDIKPHNIILLDNERDAKIADLGLAYAIDKKPPSDYAGTKKYMAPEVKHSKEQKEYSVKVDTYSLGITIAKLFGLTEEIGEKGKEKLVLVRKKDQEFLKNSFIPNIDLRENILKELQSMTHKDPNLRPSLETSLEFFNEIRLNQLSILELLNRVTCIHVEDYLKLSASKQAKLLAQLAKGQEVWLLAKKDAKPADINKVYIELSKHNLIVNREVIKCDPALSQHAISDYAKQKEAKDKNIYITTECRTEKNLGITQIKFIKPRFVSQRHMDFVIEKLKADDARIKDYYGEKSTLYIGRSTEINIVIAQLENPSPPPTYAALYTALNNLQENLYSSNPLYKLIEQTGLKNISTSRKVVADIIKESKKLTRTIEDVSPEEVQMRSLKVK